MTQNHPTTTLLSGIKIRQLPHHLLWYHCRLTSTTITKVTPNKQNGCRDTPKCKISSRKNGVLLFCTSHQIPKWSVLSLKLKKLENLQLELNQQLSVHDPKSSNYNLAFRNQNYAIKYSNYLVTLIRTYSCQRTNSRQCLSKMNVKLMEPFMYTVITW